MTDKNALGFADVCSSQYYRESISYL